MQSTITSNAKFKKIQFKMIKKFVKSVKLDLSIYFAKIIHNVYAMYASSKNIKIVMLLSKRISSKFKMNM